MRLSNIFSGVIYFMVFAFVLVSSNVFAAELQPPRIISPLERGEFRDTHKIAFAWRLVPGAAAYNVVLAKDREFNNVVFEDVKINVTSFSVDDLSYGTYFFKIRPIDSNGDKGPFSDTLSFVIVPQPPQPVIEKRLRKEE